MRLSPVLLALAAMSRSVHCDEGDPGIDFNSTLLTASEGDREARKRQDRKPILLGGQNGERFAIFLRKDKSKCLQPTKLESGATFEISQCKLRGKQLFNTGKYGIVYSRKKSLCVKGAPNEPLQLVACPNLKSKRIKQIAKAFRYKINTRKKIIISGKIKNMVWTLTDGVVETIVADLTPGIKRQQKIWAYVLVPEALPWPSASPTDQPSQSRLPSMVPSNYPSTVPSVNPTELPSMSPIVET
eukprot:CAMPEP_0194275372 /NCGR_PEP_ID=MMETSP0169-20130528/8227_1 /TAXON_ID=218684 /ORGANISM="Corethron pennatum, Strain L29A3" /LENGTH=242 /DNA_ID=CAMNT_0039018813 /DNA_START=71 /DNA_END=799 /DNA_ORIENTATION=-